MLWMDGEVKVGMKYEGVGEEWKWEGVKGYVRNRDIGIEDVYRGYENVWDVEGGLGIGK